MFAAALWRNILVNAATSLRDRQALFWSVGFPLGFTFLFVAIFGRGSVQEKWTILTQMTAIAIAVNVIFNAAMPLVNMRELQILRRYKVTPVPLTVLLFSIALSQMFITVMAVMLVVVLTIALLKAPLTISLAKFVVVAISGISAMQSLGLIIGAIASNMRAAVPIAQLLFMPMIFLSGATVPEFLIPLLGSGSASFYP